MQPAGMIAEGGPYATTRCSRLVGLGAMVAALSVLAPTGWATADEPTTSEMAMARSLFRQGIAAAQESRWEDARDAFEQSYSIAPRPTTLLNLAGSYAKTGKLVEAHESYRRFLAEESKEPAPRKRAVAEAAMAELEPRLAYVQVTIDGIELEDEVVLDGAVLDPASLLEEIPVNPGIHELVLRREGFAAIVVEVPVDEGEHRVVPFAARRGVSWLPLDERAALGREVGPTDDSPVEPRRAARNPRRKSASGPPTVEPTDESLLDSPFVWIAAGILVVGAGIGAYALTRDDSRSAFGDGTLTPGVLIAD